MERTNCLTRNIEANEQSMLQSDIMSNRQNRVAQDERLTSNTLESEVGIPVAS